MENSFEIRKSIDGEYFNLFFCDKKVYQDSANDDLYDRETAEAYYDEVIDGLSPKWVGVMKSAISEGYEPSLQFDLNDMFIDAENYLCAHVADDDCFIDIITDFWNSPRYLYWSDKHNVCCCEQSGEIVADDYRMRSYYRYDGKNLESVKYWHSEDEDVYCFLDKVVDSDGNVWILLG